MSFDLIHNQIQAFLSAQKEDPSALGNKCYKLPLSDALFCAEDVVRNRAFFQGIQQAIQERPERPLTVVDAGSGTGILGAFALALGAEKCFFLEHNPHSLELSKKLVDHLGFKEQSVFIECDATQVELPEPYDILISETLSSGFVTEDFPRIVAHLKRYGKPGSVIIPERFRITMTEEDEGGRELEQTVWNIQSRKVAEDKRPIAKNQKTRSLCWHTKGWIYGDIAVESGDCMSFLNEIKTKY